MITKEKNTQIHNNKQTSQPPANKLSKKAQKAAKQSLKQTSQKPIQKREFTQLSVIRTVSLQELLGSRSLLVKNKKVSEYVEELTKLSLSEQAIVIGCDKNIPKAISVVEAFKHSLGFYTSQTANLQQINQICQDNIKTPIIKITLKTNRL